MMEINKMVVLEDVTHFIQTEKVIEPFFKMC